ncbi:MAG: HIT family protein [archaeon]
MGSSAGDDSESISDMQRQQCIFCKIASGEIPSKKIYEDDIALVILDINPAGEGHCLILPKKHYQIMPQVPQKELGHLFIVAKKVSHALLRGLSASGTSIFVANGAVAGQKAPHFIIHVMPRREGDGLFNIPKKNVKEDELERIMQMLGAKLGFKTSVTKIDEKKPMLHLENKKKHEELEAEEIHEEENSEVNKPKKKR